MGLNPGDLLSVVPRDVLVKHVFADFAPIELLICSRVCHSWRTGFIESGLLPLPDRCELLDSIRSTGPLSLPPEVGSEATLGRTGWKANGSSK